VDILKNGAVLGEITMNTKASKLPPLDISVDNINMIDKNSMTINGKNVLLNLKKNFTTRGLMDKETYIRTLGKDFATKARLYDVEKIVRRYQKVMESTYGKDIPLEITETINDALLGRYELIEMLDPNVRSVVEEMRDYIDSMSQQMIDEGIVQGELAGIVSRNLGVYVNRTYEIFENPGYEVPIELFNKAVSGLIESYNEKGLQLTKDEAENILNEVFDEMKEKGLTDTSAYLKVNDIMKRNVDAFKKRKDIPSWMMEAMGETTDPAANFYNTSVKQIHIIEQSLFLSDLRDIGFKNGFLSKTRSEKFPKRIAKAKDSKYNPYFPLTKNEALYTTPEFAEVLNMFTSEPGRASSLVWGLQTANYLFKYGATVGSVQTHIRNFLSNTLVVMAMGYAPFSPAIFKEMYKSTYPDGKVNESEFRKLISLGIIKDGAYSGEIADIIKDLQGNENVPYEKMISGKSESIFKKGANVLTKAYQAEDDFWKVYLYYALKPDYAVAYPNATDEQLDLMVAKDIAKHVPTYSRIPNAIKQLRKLPLIGTFPSFVSEMIRNNINHVIDIPKMIKDEKTRSMGLKRAAGLLSASLGVEMLISTIKNLLPDWDDEKSEALQQVVPWWSRNSAVVPVEYDDKQVYYFDISSLDPFAHIKKSSKSFAKIVSDGFSQEELIEEYLREAFGPFLGAEPVAEALAECIANRDALGREIYNRTEDGGSIATKCWNHIAKVITPGTLKSIEKIADPKRDAGLELLSTFAGVRISKLELDKTYYFSVQKAVNDSQENVRIYYSVGQDSTDQEKEEALKTANEKLQETMRKVYQSRINLETLGLDPAKAKRQTRMPSQKNIYLGATATVSMYSGLYFPIIPNHRDVNQQEYQQVQQSVRQGLIDGLLTESQAENILTKYAVGSKVNRRIKDAVDTGDRTLDFEIERLLKREIK
jgi:hypothetical protein